jgi:hypothetical protein
VVSPNKVVEAGCMILKNFPIWLAFSSGRLLYKAQQLGFNHMLPDEEVLVNTLHRRCFAARK